MNYISFFMKKISNIIAIIENTICEIGIWMCTILLFLGVINRYFLHFPIMWINDLALYSFIFYILFSIALSARKEGHIGVDVFRVKFFKGKAKADIMYSIFLRIISFIVALIFTSTTYKFLLRAVKYPEYGTLVRWFNTSWLMSALFFVMILTLIHIFELVIKDIIKLKNIDTALGVRKE